MVKNQKHSKRKQILIAATTIVKEEGVAQLTLEAVANKANVSKGGLLYHFPNKEALIKGMIDELTKVYVDEIEETVQNEGHTDGRWSKAYVKSTFLELEDGFDMSSALVAAIYTNPELLEKLQQQYEEWQIKIENDGIDPVRATIARLAADGLWFAEIFGLGPLKSELKEQVYKELINWTEGVK